MARSGRAPDTPPPAFQFYPGDFLADEHVDSMTLAERGAHITLLCHAWRSGSTPCEPPALARMLHISRVAMAKLWLGISPCWVPGEDGRLVQPRLERERAVQAAYRADRAANGRKGAAKRWPSYSDPNAEPIANDGSSSSSSITTTTPPKSAGASPAQNGKQKKQPYEPKHGKTRDLCGYLGRALKHWKPSARIQTESTRSMREMDLMLRKDRRDVRRVKAVLDWLFLGEGGCYAPDGEFDWRPNVNSGATLRKHFDKLESAFLRDAGLDE